MSAARVFFDHLADVPNFPDAACKGIEYADMFFPTPGTRGRPAYNEAVKVCAGCPHRIACLKWAMTHRVEGVWGGTSFGQRRRAS